MDALERISQETRAKVDKIVPLSVRNKEPEIPPLPQEKPQNTAQGDKPQDKKNQELSSLPQEETKRIEKVQSPLSDLENHLRKELHLEENDTIKFDSKIGEYTITSK